MAQACGNKTRTAGIHEQIVKSLASGVIVVDASGEIVLSNPAAGLQLAVPEDLLQPGMKLEALPGFATFGEAFAEIAGEGHSIARREMSFQTPGGGKTLGVSVYPLQDSGRFSGAIFLFMDLTEIRRLERASELNRQLAQVGELTAGIVHELRNPLSVISGMAELLKRQLPEEPPLIRRAAAIVQEAAHMEHLIGQFLGFSRPFEIERQHCSAAEVVDRARQLCQKLAHDKGVGIETAIAPGCGRLTLDSGKIAQALSNLLRNGIEVSPEETKVRLAAHQEAGAVVFVVRDSGPGLDLKPGEDPFVPFFSRKEGGTGLGLSIVHRIVTAHHGSVRYRNLPEGGAEFEIRIPQEM